jgi:formylglycine-generating enzyme required for sulfatase activity
LSELLLDAQRSEIALKGVIGKLAFEAQQEGAGTEGEALADIKEWQLVKALTQLHPEKSMDWANQMINTIKFRAGLLLEREPGVYSFPHRTFQEYLAGSHLATRPDFIRDAVDLAAETALWREVIMLSVGRLVHVQGDAFRPLALAGELCPAGEDDNDTAWRKAWLAGDVLLEVGLNRVQDSNLGNDSLERVRQRLAALLQKGRLAPVERAGAGDTLAHLGDPRFRADAWHLPAEPLLGFVEIKAGPFLMGSDSKHDKEAFEEELDQHSVELPAFYMARHPVTVAQFRAFVRSTRYEAQGPWQDYSSYDNHPVVAVTWYDALEYGRWLTGQLQQWPDTPEHLKDLLRDKEWQVRLPTEAEWEKAARGSDGRIFPWGDKAESEKANYDDTGIGTTSAVGCFPAGASPYDIYDMSGNVWEWTHSLWGKDWKKPEFKYPYDPSDGRENESADKDVLRVLRGGSFLNLARDLRCASRLGYNPDYWYWYLGFRVVVAPGLL